MIDEMKLKNNMIDFTCLKVFGKCNFKISSGVGAALHEHLALSSSADVTQFRRYMCGSRFFVKSGS